MLSLKAGTKISAIASRFLWSCRDRTLRKTKPCLFRLLRGELAPTKGTGIEAHYHSTHHHGRALPLHRHLRADGATGAVIGRVRTEDACPPRKPLVESFRTFLPVNWPRMLPQSSKKGQ
jgi:hypothetical protein